MPVAGVRPDMDPEEVARRIEAEIEGATADVRRARGEHDDDHLAATVVAPAFADLSIVEQHERVYDALEGAVTRDVHALELTTRAPDD